MKKILPDKYTGLWVKTVPSNNIFRYEIEYVNGIEHGKYRTIHIESGIVTREGNKVNGKDHGEIILRSFLSGKVIGRYEFYHGTGTHIILHEDGRLGWKIQYKSGKQHGLKKQYELGLVILEEKYVEGVLVSRRRKRPIK